MAVIDKTIHKKQDASNRMNYSHPFLLILRRAGQRLGILRPLVRAYRKSFNKQYEARFDKKIISAIKSGDIIWDVGANVGYFTKKFAEVTGSHGAVVAFEPSRGSFGALKDATSFLKNVTIEKLALSDFDGKGEFRVTADSADPTNSLVSSAGDNSTETVVVQKGDTYCSAHQDRLPHAIKIDVEGFELEVLRGLTQTLKLPRLRSIFIEVHFAVLIARGFSSAPNEISRLLRESGFHVHWTDPSHIVASKT